MDKQMLKYVGILVGLLFLLILFLLLFGGSKEKKVKLSYEDLETKLVDAAKKYVNDKKKKDVDILPDSPLSDSTYLSAELLANEGYIKNLSEYVKDDTKCIGGVDIYYVEEDKYDYVPDLECGNYHHTQKLADKVIEDNDGGITVGSGLYQRIDGEFVTDDRDLNMFNSSDYEYVFRGDDVNNFVKIDDNLWRIVSIDDENNMLLILNSTSRLSLAWDERYNEDVQKYRGINDFYDNGLESNIYKALQDFYKGKIELFNKEVLSDKTAYYVVPMDLCVGKRSETDEDFSGKLECQKVLENQIVGLLPAYYFMSASLDANCNSIISKSCGNYNYMTQFDDIWWLLTADTGETDTVFAVSHKVGVTNYCSFRSSLRPTIMVGSRATYLDGDGSFNNPYQMKFYNQEK